MMNVRALKARLRVVEVASFEKPRVHGASKLHTIADGWRVLKTIIKERVTRPLTEVFAIQGEIAGGVARVLRLLSRRAPKPWPTQNPQAYLLYLKGRSAWERITPGGARAAIELFEQAAVLDSTYAHAYAGIADGYSQLNFTSSLKPKETCPAAARAARRSGRFRHRPRRARRRAQTLRRDR